MFNRILRDRRWPLRNYAGVSSRARQSRNRLVLLKEIQQALRRPFSETHLESFVRLNSGRRNSGKKILLIRAERGFEVTRVIGDRFPEFSAVVHCQICAFSIWRVQVGCIAEQRRSRYAIPSVLRWERMKRARHGCRLAVGDEHCQTREPSSSNSLGYAGPRSYGAGEVNTINPLFWLP